MEVSLGCTMSTRPARETELGPVWKQTDKTRNEAGRQTDRHGQRDTDRDTAIDFLTLTVHTTCMYLEDTMPTDTDRARKDTLFPPTGSS